MLEKEIYLENRASIVYIWNVNTSFVERKEYFYIRNDAGHYFLMKQDEERLM